MIRSDDFANPHARYSFPEHEDVQERALSALVDEFAEAMKTKLLEKMREGYRGWDNPALKGVLNAKIWEHSRRHVTEGGQMVDVACLAAMVWNIEREESLPAVESREVEE